MLRRVLILTILTLFAFGDLAPSLFVGTAVAQEQPVKAVTNVALPDPDPGLPSVDYMRQIIDGAVAHSFPDDYVAILKAFPVDTGV